MTSPPSVSYQGPMSENEYLAIVERIQQAMAIEPFQPSVIDVVKLLSDWRDWSREIERLRTENQRASDLGLQMSLRISDLSRENERLQAANERLREANADLRLSSENLRSLLAQRGPYCAQHGELQPCSQHRWALASDKAKDV